MARRGSQQEVEEVPGKISSVSTWDASFLFRKRSGVFLVNN